jgi:DNA polymerase-3 subunit alpha
MARSGFAHLHTHSHYSLLEALPKVPELVKAAKKAGQSALALTDNGNLYGALEFYKECKGAGIKPIIGVDFFVAARTRFDKEHRVDDESGRLVLLAKNEAGYRNLLALVSKSYLEGFFHRPRIDRELMEAHRDGLIAILPSYGGEVAYALRHRVRDRASRALKWYTSVYGTPAGGCYVEVTRHPEIPEHEQQMRTLVEFAGEHGVPLLAAHDVYYLSPEDGLACDLVNKIRTGSVLDRESGEYRIKDFSFLPTKRMEELFKDMPEALENTGKVAEMCDLELKLGTWVFPSFPIPSGSSADKELKKLAYAGFAGRGLPQTPELLKRADYELDIIASKGYAPYFLVVADLLRHARERGILTNTRGSAAGSLVSYLSGITTVDPIKYDLPFERFLNPERPSPPDIDMDLADNRRDELIEYVRGKYGDAHVAQIGTFGTMMARAAVRDVARALGQPYMLGDRIAKLIPFGKQGFSVTIADSLKDVPELSEIYRSDPDAREVLDLAQKIEGNARHVGVHAAGVVIAPSPVSDYVPIQLDPKGGPSGQGKIITQYDMYAVEDAGLLKFDFLGLTNLSILADAVERVRARRRVTLDLDTLPLDDTKTYELLSRGETLGVFQLSGQGMTSYLIELKPSSIHDINAMVALYRPGPMAFIPAYIERKKDPRLVKYLDPRMENILQNSYGVIVYQDDVLQIARELAGYSWLEADKLRKAMGKKIPKEMAAQKEHFTKGCIEHGMKKDAVQKLWEQIETFAAYGFGKAHAASYGNLAYKTAYMKANFPVDYMAALLTADAGDVEKIAEVVGECRRMHIEVLPPSVNESRGAFTVIDDAHIRFGLYSIKNFGQGVADSIMRARDDGGPFTDIADFLARTADRSTKLGAGNTLNKKSLESLIQSGALDAIGERGAFLAALDTLLEFHRSASTGPSNQTMLFAPSSAARKLELPAGHEAPLEEKLRWEKELLGLYVSGHPLDKFKEKFKDPKKTIRHAKEHARGLEAIIAGFVENARINMTKNGERIAFLRLADFSGSIDLTVFPRVFKEYANIMSAGSCIAVKGKISERNGETSFVVEKAKAL